MVKQIFFSILILMFFCNTAMSSERGEFITRLLKLPVPESIELCGETVPLDYEDVAERIDLELIVALADPTSVALWFKRGERHFPLIEKKINEYSLPLDLKYVAVIESNLRAEAVSSARAVGPWQFIGSTGKNYGLRRTSWVEDRKNWDKATDAALRHLADLRQRFDSWPLALAAYNAGEMRILSSMKVQGQNNYYGLRLPRETERYVFRIIAAKLIMEQPESYGIDIAGAQLYPPETTIDYSFQINRLNMPISVIADAAGVSYRKLKLLNPWMASNSLPKGEYVLTIPASVESGFESVVAGWEKANPEPETEYYQVRKGDTLSKIAKRHGVSLSDLYSWNSLNSRSIILPGQKIAIKIIN